MRLAVGGIAHETNTWADDVTGRTTLDRFVVERGPDLVARARTSGDYLGGMVTAATELGMDVVGTVFAQARPSGTITRDTYEQLKSELLTALAGALPVDAVGLALHGAGVVDGIDDLEGDLVTAVRDVVGPDVPLVATLDLHANLTDRMVDGLDVVLPVKLYPHTDAFDRGAEAVRHVPDLVARRLRPTACVVHLPMLLPPATTDAGSPAAAMNDVCRDVQRDAVVLDCSVCHGFPFTDTPDVGVHVLVTTNDDPALAAERAREVASWIWSHRDDFIPEAYDPPAAVARATSLPGRPIVVNDTSDNPGGGTPGDGTHLLRALVDADADAAFAFLCDPAALAVAHAGGPGAEIDVELGGHHGPLHGPPIRARARVRSLTDGRFVIHHGDHSYPMDLGPMARVSIGRVDVLVAGRAHQVYGPEIFELHGIDVTRRKIVAVKSSNHFRAGFRDVAAAIVTADSPGLTTLRVDRLQRFRAPGPMWPAATDITWPS